MVLLRFMYDSYTVLPNCACVHDLYGSYTVHTWFMYDSTKYEIHTNNAKN